MGVLAAHSSPPPHARAPDGTVGCRMKGDPCWFCVSDYAYDPQSGNKESKKNPMRAATCVQFFPSAVDSSKLLLTYLICHNGITIESFSIGWEAKDCD